MNTQEQKMFGAMGGRAKHPKKGFGSNPELAKEASRKGVEARRKNRYKIKPL